MTIRLHTGIDHSLRTDLRPFHELRQLIQLLTGVVSRMLRTDTTDISRIIEHGETVAFHHIHQLHERHTETQIRLVATVILHGVLPSHPAQRLFHLYATQGLEEVFDQALKQVQDVLLLHETHLTVNLRELRLTIRTQILVAETLHDLEITIETRHHQQLLQGLRALRERIELSGIHTRRHHEVTGTLRRGVHQHRCLHLQE